MLGGRGRGDCTNYQLPLPITNFINKSYRGGGGGGGECVSGWNSSGGTSAGDPGGYNYGKNGNTNSPGSGGYSEARNYSTYKNINFSLTNCGHGGGGGGNDGIVYHGAAGSGYGGGGLWNSKNYTLDAKPTDYGCGGGGRNYYIIANSRISFSSSQTNYAAGPYEGGKGAPGIVIIQWKQTK